MASSSSDFKSRRSLRLEVDWSEIPRPREAFFDLTNYCNHSCFFCSNHRIGKKEFLDSELLNRLLEESKELGVTDVGLYSTGEPFARVDLAQIVQKCKLELKFPYVFITTNGALASPARAKPVLDAGLDSVKFSVNAGNRESYKKVHGKDDFDKVVRHIKWFFEYRQTSGLKYGIYASMVPTHLTEGQWPELMSHIGKYLDDSNLRGCSNQGGNMVENNATESIAVGNLLGSLDSNQKTSGRCPDPFFRIVVTPEGYLTACVVDYQNNLIISDLRHTSLKEAWESRVYQHFRRAHMDKKVKGLICQNCLHNTCEKTAPLQPKYFKPFANSPRIQKREKPPKENELPKTKSI